MTGRDTGATRREYGEYIMETMQHPEFLERWKAYRSGKSTA
jgi:hypothetical protein